MHRAFTDCFMQEAFYLLYRQVTSHPCFNTVVKFPRDRETGRWHSPATYAQDRSFKMDAVLGILQHHLAADNRRHLVLDPAVMTWQPPPPQLSEDEEDEEADTTPVEIPDAANDPHIALIPNPAYPDPPPVPEIVAAMPDKIIVYLAWVASYNEWQSLLNAHGIRFLSLTGKHSPKEKEAILREFRLSGRDGPRVLLMSRVGLYGHNISCANIIVIVVRAALFPPHRSILKMSTGPALVRQRRPAAHRSRLALPPDEVGDRVSRSCRPDDGYVPQSAFGDEGHHVRELPQDIDSAQ